MSLAGGGPGRKKDVDVRKEVSKSGEKRKWGRNPCDSRDGAGGGYWMKLSRCQLRYSDVPQSELLAVELIVLLPAIIVVLNHDERRLR